MTKILIIDDKHDNLISMRALLKSIMPNSYVITAISGPIGIKKAEKEQPDTILLDVIMPRMDGYQVCKKLKGNNKTKHIPIIMITAIKKDSQSLIKGLESGADNFLQKPINADELKAQINVMLRIKKAEDIIRNKKEQLEKKVQESMNKFFSLVNTTSNGIIVSDNTGKITLWNNGAKTIFGYEEDEIIGKPISILIPEYLREKHKNAFKELLFTGLSKHGGKAIELEGLRKDGYVFPLELSLSNWETKGQVHFAAIIRDITERKKIMDALINANIIINRSPAVVFLWQNKKGWPVEFVSDNVNDELGYPKEKFLTGEILYESLIHKNDIDRVIKEVEINSANKKIDKFIHKPYRIITKNGNVKWIDDRTNIIKDKNGNITHYQGIILNITKHIQIEQTLKDAQTVLIQQEKMASLGNLAAGIAHEINNPLGFVVSNFRTLKNYMETMKNHLKLLEANKDSQILKTDIEKSKNRVSFIMKDIDDLFKESTDGFNRISEIVNNMRQFSRVDSENEKTFINLNDAINNTLIISRNSYKYVAEINLELTDIPEIKCNLSEINQVLLNIIVNAAQAIEQQKRKEKGIINIKTYIQKDMVCCSIKDDGPGIPEKNIKKVFDPFFTTKEIGKGTGMGLSISYDIIVNKHKGELSVKSKKNKGTTFIIKFKQENKEH